MLFREFLYDSWMIHVIQVKRSGVMTELGFKENGSPKNIDFDLVTLQDGGWEKVRGI